MHKLSLIYHDLLVITHLQKCMLMELIAILIYMSCLQVIQLRQTHESHQEALFGHTFTILIQLDELNDMFYDEASTSSLILFLWETARMTTTWVLATDNQIFQIDV